MNKIFFDTEFIDTGSAIELISIGMVKNTGETLYLVSSEFDELKCSEWLLDNVISKLGNEPRHTKKYIKEKIIDFIGTEKVEFWAYYGSYDWVVFCQLFGRMLDLPKNYFYCLRELKQEADRLNFNCKTLEKSNTEHNALADAIWNKRLYESLKN